MTPRAAHTVGHVAFAAASAARDVVACAAGSAVSALSAAGEPAKRVQLLPIGVINARDGRKWRVRDQAHAQAIVEASKAAAGQTDLPIDYDHQLVFGAKDGVGGKAPAAGWMSGLTAEPDGIWADAAWTPAADAHLRAKEYRYISPFFGFDRASGDITRICHAGLTNFPAITELAAVASSEFHGDVMDLKALSRALGLGEDATLEVITSAVTALNTRVAAANTALKAVAMACGLSDDEAPEAVAAAAAAAVTAKEPDPKAFVPMTAFKEVQGRLQSLEESAATAAATAAVDAAVASGRVTPAGRDHALRLFKADPEAFDAFVASSPVVLKPGEASAAARAQEAAAAAGAKLTAEEVAAAAAIGVSAADYLKSKKQLLGVN